MNALSMERQLRTGAILTALLLTIIAFSAGCGKRVVPRDVLWVQTAAEYRALCMQTYDAASEQLRAALDDPEWTAAPVEQQGNYSDLPPAVILDVDETVLDNSPYQAWLFRAGKSYHDETWAAWVNEADARAVPGALRYAKKAESMGIKVFYVTNREAALEDATRENLIQEGFPMPRTEDTLLMKGEREDWGSKKGTRRAAVAEDYRVLQLIGDNLGDFVDDYKSSLETRNGIVSRTAEFWGKGWFVLPNPAYGSWENALFEFDYDLRAGKQYKAKIGHLDAWEPVEE